MAAPAEAVQLSFANFSVFRAYLCISYVVVVLYIQMFMTLYGTQRTRGAPRGRAAEKQSLRG